jgi:hypothetical protein
LLAALKRRGITLDGEFTKEVTDEPVRPDA